MGLQDDGSQPYSAPTYPQQQGAQDYQQQDRPAATTNGGDGSDFSKFVDKTGQKLEDRAETHYEKKMATSAYKAEDAVFEQGDRVYGCMENAIGRWWNSLFAEKKEEKPHGHEQHLGTAAHTARD